MFSQTTSSSLQRRLSANFLICGTLIVVGLILASMLSPQAEKITFGPLAVSVTLVGLISVSIVLRRSLGPVCEIDRQLRRLADSPADNVEFGHVPENGPVSAAWNRMQGLAASRQTLEKLETRLNESLKAGGAHNSLQMLNSLPDGIAVTNRDGQISLANSAFRALLSVSADDELTEQSLGQLLPQSPINAEALQEIQSGNGSRPVSLELQESDNLADGVLKINRFPLFEGQHESNQLLWLIRDITQQKLAEKMRNEFLQTATHELRTPLMNICAYAETLELTEDLDVEQQKQFCNIINAEAMRLSRFIDELLDVDRMEAGAMSLARHETDIERMLQDVMEKVTPQMTQKQIEFEPKISLKLPKLTIDKDKMTAALVNLLGNAAKYTPAGGSVKFIVDSVGQDVIFQIEDTGIGISEDELPKVFDRFFRSDDERVREETGTGLGLAFSNEVARLHGGRIEAQSEIDQGTKFTLILPIR